MALDVDVARLTDTDLVIADAMKQDYNGLDLLRDIKDNPPTAHVSVLIYSSYRSERMVVDALDGEPTTISRNRFLSGNFSHG